MNACMTPNSLRILKGDIERVMASELPWDEFERARVVVTGAAGFLGGALVRVLLSLHPSGHIRYPLQVVALVRNPELARLRLADVADDPQLEWLSWDLSQLAIPPLGRPHFIIHAASQASPKFFTRDPVGTLLPNTVGTSALLHAAKEARRFLFVSSSEVYGLVSTNEPLLEDDFGVLDPTSRRACYAESKRLGEALCVAWHAQYGLETTIVRPFHTYGPGLASDDGRVFSDFAYAIARGEPMVMTSDGSARRAYCYISDATSGLLTVLLRGSACQAYNLGNPTAECSVFELATTLISHFNNRGARLERRQSLSDYSPSPFSRMVPNIDRLKSLGWAPQISIPEGFTRFIEAID